MATTRRLSGINPATSQPAGPMIEAYDNFRKKHLAQNKEIIHKNSELNRTNADLNRTITLMRAERLSIKGAQFKLECENSSLRTKLERAQERERDLVDKLERTERGRGWSRVEQDQVEDMRRSLANAVTALQAFGLMLPNSDSSPPSPTSPTTSSPAMPSPTPSSTSSSASLPPNSNVSVSRRRSLANRPPRATAIATRPDLSYISEGGEGSTDLDDEEDGEGWRGTILEGLREESQTLRSATNSPAPTAAPTPPSPPSPPLLTHTPFASTSSTSSKPHRLPTAPPAAPSAHLSQSVERRPARRVSGLMKLPLGGALITDEEENYGVTVGTVGSKGKGKQREEVEAFEREVLVERQAREEEEGGGGRRTSRRPRKPVLSSSSEDEFDVEEDEDDSEYEEAGARRNAPTTTSLASQRQKREPTPPPPLPRSPPVPTLAPLLQEQSEGVVRRGGRAKSPAMEDTLNGEGKRSKREIVEMEMVSEEAGSRPSSRAGNLALEEQQEQEQPIEPTEGRRARKSVNYAQPKLNTKMRRPEGYVPTTSHLHSKPRKSTKPSSSGSVPRSKSMSGQLDLFSGGESDTPLPSSSAKSSGRKSKKSGAYESDDEQDGEEQQEKAETSIPAAVMARGGTSQSKAGIELEEKRKERALSKGGAGGGAGEKVVRRRHSTFV